MKNAKVKWMWPDPLKLVNLDADKELENLALRLSQVDHYAEAIFSEPPASADALQSSNASCEPNTPSSHDQDKSPCCQERPLRRRVVGRCGRPRDGPTLLRAADRDPGAA